MENKIEILSKEIIKPSSPTPDNLKRINLSFFDILCNPIYVCAILFYAADPLNHPISQDVSLKLKKSLSETLTRFYPFGGRINEKFIDCNDEGAMFIDAQMDCLLSDFLKNPDPGSLEHLIPEDAQWTKVALWPVLIIQANFFRCGGLAIAVCTSHMITDATTMMMFIRNWADSAKGLGFSMNPEFNASNFFPVPHELPVTDFNNADFEHPTCITRRFVFDAAKIKELKTKAASALVKNPTCFESITGLFWRCANKASRSNSGTSRTSVLQTPVNLRGRVDTLSENAMGNLLSLVVLQNEESEMAEIREIVSQLRQKKKEFSLICKDKLLEATQASSHILEFVKEMIKLYSKATANELDLFTSNTWRNLHIHEADFGWGKPVWVTSRGSAPFKNIMQLIDAKDGEGVEAWITLTEEDMLIFEQDEELLEYASPNPPVSI